MANFGWKLIAGLFKWIFLCLLVVIVIIALPFWIMIELANCFFPDRMAKKRYRHLFQTLFGLGLKPAELARRLDMTLEQIHATPQEYSTRKIPKRSGGQRELDIPNE